MKKNSNQSNHYDAIIIGGGPAGCQCAMWLQNFGCRVLIVEKSKTLGGLQSTSDYPNHSIVTTIDQTGTDIAKTIARNIRTSKIPVLFNSTVREFKRENKQFKIFVDRKILTANYLVIATGVRPNPGPFKPSARILIGPSKQVFHYPFKNKTVAILGGGDNAGDNYLFAKNKKAKSITLFSRHALKMQSQIRQQISTKDIRIGHHNINPSDYDVLCVMYGWLPNNPLTHSNFKPRIHNGFFQVNTHCQTSVKNLYAIGECTAWMHPCVATALAQGTITAKAIQQSIESLKK